MQSYEAHYLALTGNPEANREMRRRETAERRVLVREALLEVQHRPLAEQPMAAARLVQRAVRGMELRAAVVLVLREWSASAPSAGARVDRLLTAATTAAAAPAALASQSSASPSVTVTNKEPKMIPTTRTESAYVQALALAKPLMDANAKLTKADALTLVFGQHPELAAQHRLEATVHKRTGVSLALDRGTGVGGPAQSPSIAYPSNGGPARSSASAAVWEKLQAIAIKLQAADPSLGKQQAIAKAVAENEALYSEYANLVAAGR